MHKGPRCSTTSRFIRTHFTFHIIVTLSLLHSLRNLYVRYCVFLRDLFIKIEMAGEGKYLHGVNHLYRSLAQLTSIVTAFQSLDKRDDDSLCPSTKYVSPNGQIFQTHCDHKLSSDADDYYYYTDTESRSFEDCMGECGTSRTLCYAVAYHTVNGHCLFFDNSTSLLGNGGGGDGKSYNVAIADVDQLDKPSGCPFKNGATYTTPNGLEFEIVCNVDYGMDAGDYCVDGYADWTCYAHADTMEDCLNFCADVCFATSRAWTACYKLTGILGIF